MYPLTNDGHITTGFTDGWTTPSRGALLRCLDHGGVYLKDGEAQQDEPEAPHDLRFRRGGIALAGGAVFACWIYAAVMVAPAVRSPTTIGGHQGDSGDFDVSGDGVDGAGSGLCPEGEGVSICCEIVTSRPAPPPMIGLPGPVVDWMRGRLRKENRYDDRKYAERCYKDGRLAPPTFHRDSPALSTRWNHCTIAREGGNTYGLHCGAL